MRVSERLGNMLPSFSETRFMERPGGTPKSARGVVPSPSRLTQALGAAPTASRAEKYESKDSSARCSAAATWPPRTCATP
jgi:hypothetical protein